MSGKKASDRIDRELEAVGITPPSVLRARLHEASDVKEEVRKFQAEHPVPVLTDLTTKLIERVQELSGKKSTDAIKTLEAQLDRCFRLYRIPTIRPVVLETIKGIPKLSNKYLKKIADDSELYSECDVSVKQQIWANNDKFFVKAVRPVIEDYVEDKEKVLTFTGPSQTNFFTCDTTKTRRQKPQVRELVKMVESNDKLYRRLVEIIRDRYVKTDSAHFCSLRLELVMAMHDKNVDSAVKMDPIHDFAWCLDACVRDKHLDAQQIKKLQAILDKKGFLEESAQDVCMVVADSHVLHFLCMVAIRVLHDSTRTCATIPRDHPILFMVVRLLYLGLYAKEVLMEEMDVKQVTDPDCIIRFMPLLVQVMAEDQIRTELHRAPDEVSDEFLPDFEVRPHLPPGLVCFVREDAACALLFLHYLCSVMAPKRRANNKQLLHQYFELAFAAKGALMLREPWAHFTVYRMCQTFTNELEKDDLAKLVVEDGFLAHLDALAKLRAGFEAGENDSLEARKKHLNAMKSLLQENEKEICDAVYKDLRKPSFEVISYETSNVIGEIDNAICNLKQWTSPEKVTRYILQATDAAYIQREPLGTVLVLGAWNFPIQLCLVPVVGALAAGNTVLLKPSELAPATDQLLRRLCANYFSDSVLKVLSAGPAQTTELLKQRFDHIFYTGSTRVGKIVMKAAAEHLTPVTLEMGGKSPTIVDLDADLAVAARRICWGKFNNAGQMCVAPDYVLVVGDRERREQFSAECAKQVTAFYGEQPQKSPDFGRIVNQAQFDRIAKVLAESRGQVVHGGGHDRDDLYVAPTVTQVDEDDATMEAELFAPIMPVLHVPSLDDAIKLVKRREKPLVLYLFTNNRATLDRVQHETSSGSLTINDTVMHMALNSLPFGGVGQSGMGCCHGVHSFNTFTHPKAVLHRGMGFEKLLWMRYPPFSADKLAWIYRVTLRFKMPF